MPHEIALQETARDQTPSLRLFLLWSGMLAYVLALMAVLYLLLGTAAPETSASAPATVSTLDYLS